MCPVRKEVEIRCSIVYSTKDHSFAFVLSMWESVKTRHSFMKLFMHPFIRVFIQSFDRSFFNSDSFIYSFFFFINLFIILPCLYHFFPSIGCSFLIKGQVSKEAVVLRRWEYYKIIWFYQLG